MGTWAGLGAGFMELIGSGGAEGHVNAKTSFEFSQGWTADASSGEGRAMTQVSTLGLRGRKLAPTAANRIAVARARRALRARQHGLRARAVRDHRRLRPAPAAHGRADLL